MLMTLVYKYALKLMEASIKLSYQICKEAKDKDKLKEMKNNVFLG